MECKTGIYLITHIASGRPYVGLTGVSFNTRWSEHKHGLRSGKYKNYKKLLHAWQKYGEEAFSFSVHTYISKDNLTDDEFYSVLRMKEAQVLKLFPKNFNSTIAGKSGMKVTQEVRAKISNSHKGMKHSLETRKKISENTKKQWKDPTFAAKVSRKGSKLSPEHIAAIIKAVKGNQYSKGRECSEAHKAAISAANKGHSRNKGFKHSEEAKVQIKETKAKRKLTNITC